MIKLMEITQIYDWYENQMNQLKKEIAKDSFLNQWIDDLSNWYQEFGKDTIKPVNIESFKSEINHYINIGNAEMKIKYLSIFPNLTKVHQRL